MTRSKISWIITIGAIIVVLIHLLWPTIAIDSVTLTLLAIAIIPWLAPLFKSVELPSGFKVEFADLQKTQKKAQSVGLLARRARGEGTEIDDPNLALADLRIALERKLRKIAKHHGISSKRENIDLILQDFQRHDLLSREQSSLLSDLLAFLNTAVHGAQVDPRASQWAAEVGPRLIAGLEFSELVNIDELVDRWQRRDGAAFQEIGYELSEAAARSPRGFLHAMSSNKSALNTWIEGLPYHTFTIYESQNDLQDDLYMAYYERLRLRMITAVSFFHDDPDIGGTAKLISQRLSEMKVRAVS